MTEPPQPGPQGTGPSGTTRVSDLLRDPKTRTSVVIALAVLAGLIVWIVAESGGGSSGSKSTSTTPSTPSNATTQVADSEAALRSIVGSYAQQVYWLGPIPGTKYEVTRLASGVSVRYVSASGGDSQASTTIATYPVQNAYQTTIGHPSAGAEMISVPGGGTGVINKERKTSVYIAFPKVDYQIELFNPNPVAAKLLASGGRLRVVGQAPPRAETGGPNLATTAELRALSTTLGHPVYWLGHWGKFRYELTQTPSGNVYIRYLPPGVPVGSKRHVLSIATYPLKNAFAITSKGASAQGYEKLDVPGGGVGSYSPQNPHTVYLAFPGVDVQVEIYAPPADLVRKLVANGKVVALGLGG